MLILTQPVYLNGEETFGFRSALRDFISGFQISMKLPLAKIELGPIYDRLMHKFSFSGLKMRLAGL